MDIRNELLQTAGEDCSQPALSVDRQPLRFRREVGRKLQQPAL